MRLTVKEEVIREFEIDTDDLEEAKRLLLAEQYQPASVFAGLGVENDEVWKKTLASYDYGQRRVREVTSDGRGAFTSVYVSDEVGRQLSDELMKEEEA